MWNEESTQRCNEEGKEWDVSQRQKMEKEKGSRGMGGDVVGGHDHDEGDVVVIALVESLGRLTLTATVCVTVKPIDHV